jgi:hypothetical protein
MTDHDKVGYGKPPKHSRFKPGESGNPRGRPKGTRNLRTDLRDELRERIPLREGQAEKRVSKQRALIKSLMAKAIKGDTRAANLLLTIMLRLLEPLAGDEADAPLTDEERAVIEDFERRVRRKDRQGMVGGPEGAAAPGRRALSTPGSDEDSSGP